MSRGRRVGDKRQTSVVLLCEDQQHAVFVRRLLREMGWTHSNMRTEFLSPGSGSAEQFVRERFVKELAEYRRVRNRVSATLVVMIDGDRLGPARRRAELKDACQSQGVAFLESAERVLIAVPTWQIETWFAYLDGEDVDETKRDYRRLSRPRDCERHVDKLAEMCRRNALRSPAPRSLVSACDEYKERLAS